MRFGLAKLIIIFLGVFFLPSCSNDAFAPGTFSNDSGTGYARKNIFTSEGGIDTPYDVLGPVESSVTHNFPMLSNPAATRDEIIENLKQTAVSRYGANVDAIINIEIHENANQEDFFSPTITYARGLAIAYKSAGKSYSKSKKRHKAKSSKYGATGKSKTSRYSSHKTAPEPEIEDEPEITPEELLK